MKRTIGRFGLIPAILALLFTQAVFASGHELTDSQKQALGELGVPVYPGATFLTSDEDVHIVLWFDTTDAPDKILDWYEDQLPDWSVTTISNTRLVYKGAAGLSMKEIMALPYIFVTPAEQTTDETSNEITIRIPSKS